MEFDEIKNTWKNSFKNTEILNKEELETRLKIGSKSNTALNKIKRSYRFELILGIPMFLGIIICLFIFLNFSYKIYFIPVAILFLGWTISFTWRNYYRIRKTVISSDQLKPALDKTIRDIEKYVNFNMSSFAKFIIIPFSFAFGMLMGLSVAAGEKDFAELFLTMETRMVVKMILIMIIGSAFMIPFSQYINKRLYKQHLDKLKSYLKEFEEIEK
ncbi:MAG TPA: hypothetical protein DCG75_11225 [Bacteroidales bacterium]|nr:hypothetical protein [Bacteroidales bacterium]